MNSLSVGRADYMKESTTPCLAALEQVPEQITRPLHSNATDSQRLCLHPFLALLHRTRLKLTVSCSLSRVSLLFFFSASKHTEFRPHHQAGALTFVIFCIVQMWIFPPGVCVSQGSLVEQNSSRLLSVCSQLLQRFIWFCSYIFLHHAHMCS